MRIVYDASGGSKVVKTRYEYMIRRMTQNELDDELLQLTIKVIEKLLRELVMQPYPAHWVGNEERREK